MFFPQPYISIVLNGLSVGLPKWFVTLYEPYLEMAERYKKIEEKRISSSLGNDKPDFERWKVVRSAVWNQINAEKDPLIIDLYIKTIDKFKNSKWPTEFVIERDISILFCSSAICVFYKGRKAPISDKLADAIIHNPYACQSGYISVLEFVKAGFVRDAKSADFLAPILFNDGLLCGNCISCIKLISEWIKYNLISPQKYIGQMSKFIGSKYLTRKYNYDSERRELLDAVKDVDILTYEKLVWVFNSEIKRYNIESFNSYKRDKDNFPQDFIAYPFADGTRMRIVKGLFSWRLK